MSSELGKCGGKVEKKCGGKLAMEVECYIIWLWLSGRKMCMIYGWHNGLPTHTNAHSRHIYANVAVWVIYSLGIGTKIPMQGGAKPVQRKVDNVLGPFPIFLFFLFFGLHFILLCSIHIQSHWR